MLGPQTLDHLGGRRAQLVQTATVQRAQRHASRARELRHTQLARGMLAHQRKRVGERVVRVALREQGFTELRLEAGATRVDDEPRRSAIRDATAEILLDQGERHVDTGGDACRRPHAAVSDEDGVGIDRDLRTIQPELATHRPMRRGAAPVQNARAGEQECARAHRADAPDDRSRAREKVTQGRTRERTANRALFTADDEHRVRRPRREARERLGGEHDARRGAHAPPSDGRQHDAIFRAPQAAIRRREHLGRAKNIESLSPIEADQQHAHWQNLNDHWHSCHRAAS